MRETLKLTVTGMTCGGCENAVKKTLAKLPGVESVSASHADATVVVDYDASRVPREAIEDAIGKLGYVVART